MVLNPHLGDTMLGSLMQHNDIDGVIVGADRIVKNGDTANKVSPAQQSQLIIRNEERGLIKVDWNVSSCCPGPTS